MKKQIYTFVAILIGLTVSSVTVIRAQSATTGKAHIPFDFSVKNQTIAAGDYVINRQDNRGEAWSLRNVDNNQSVMLLVMGVEIKRTADKGKMTFRRYGDKYFLASIETSVYQMGFRKSRAERDLEKKSETNRLAKNKVNGATPEIVFIEMAM